MKNIVDQRSNLPAEAPVMVLPQATLFKRALMPLYIFEPGYRAMLSHSLSGSRMFCMAMMKPGLSEAKTEKDFYRVAGLGLVRACIKNADGTSRLILQGIARVELVDFVQHAPFRVARIRELRSIVEPDDETITKLAAAVVAKAKALQREQPEPENAVDAHLDSLEDPEVLADLVSHSFVSDPIRRQRLLEELDVRHRLAMLLDDLRAEA